MIKKTVAFVLLLALAVNLVGAYSGRVAYIARNTNSVKQPVVDALEQMGFTVNPLLSSNLGGVNWSNYAFIVVNEDIFHNFEEIPVNEVKSLIFNTWNLNDFHWAKQGSQYASSHPIILLNQNPDHIITKGLPSQITVYTTAKSDGVNLAVNYLYRFYKAPRLQSVVSTIINSLDAVIATAEPGTKLRDGVTANEKGVFFGIVEADYWTEDAKKLFENTVEWLMTDTSPPVIIGNVTVSEITETAARIQWETDDASTTVVDYGIMPFIDQNASSPELVTEHNLVLTGLEPTTEYLFNVTSCNDYGYCTTEGPFTFSTKDLTPPNIITFNVSNITDHEAEVLIESSEPVNQSLYLGTDKTGLALVDQATGFSSVRTHTFTGLKDHTTYYTKAYLCDSHDNCAWSNVKNFTTADYTAPGAPSNLTAYVINANSHIMLNWTPPDENDVDHYNVYIANSPTGFDFGEVYATTASSFLEDTTSASASQRFYIVRAEDAYGNEENNSNIVGKFDIPLVEGMNLVSLPLTPFNNSIRSVMHQDASFHPVVSVRRLANGTWETAVFNPDNLFWEGDIGFDTLENNMGYYFNSTVAYMFTEVGHPPEAHQSVGLPQGMNMVGWTSLNPRGLSEAFPQDGSVSNVFNYMPTGRFEVATFYPQNAPNYWWSADNFSGLLPGHGYFLKASEATIWGYEP